MPNSNGFGRRSGGTVTVIEQPVRRSAARNAKIVFWVLWAVVTLLAATILASIWHPLVALLAGLGIGLVTALIVAAVVAAWPVIRAIWWWLPEIILATGLVAGWVWLADRLTFIYMLAAISVIAFVLAVIPQGRHAMTALAWCLITRHRIRTCFNEFIVYNRTGSLPLILWCIPTPVGERVWVFLRPGLSLDAIQTRAAQIAVACWADSVVAEAASHSNSALVRLDLKRRDALTGTVASPLLGQITPGAPPRERDTTGVPTALDLPDITPADVAPEKPTRPKRTPAVPVPDATGDKGERDDLSDWL